MFLVTILLCTILSCSLNTGKSKNKDLHIDIRYDTYVKNHFTEYQNLYHEIHDTLENWGSLHLECSKYYYTRFELDSLVVINKAKDRLYTNLNILSRIDSKLEHVMGFRGHLIDGKWYFTMGATYSCYRTKYKDNLNEPFTFEQLSYLARTKYIGRFLKENEQGELVPNEEEFQDCFFNAFSEKNRNLDFIEAFILKQIYYMHRDTLDQETIDDITEDVVKRKAAVLSAPPRAYKKTYPPKLFDSEAWKNRHKAQKN